MAASDAPARTVGGGGDARKARCWTYATLVLTAGGLVLAALLGPPAPSSPDRALAFLLFVGSSGHVASTGWLFTLREVRSYAASRPTRYLVAPAALVVSTATAAALLTPAQLDWLLLAFFAWQFFHFQKQNLGMVALVAASQGLPSLRRSERRAIVAAGAAGIAGLLARPSLLQLKLHRANGEFFAVVATVFVLIALLGVTRLLVRPPADRPPSFSAAYLVALLFFSPVFAFSSPYAAVGGMTVAHGLQYLLLVGLIAGSGGTNRRRAVSVATFCNVALLGGLALSFASHLHRAPGAARLLFGAYLGVVTAHFVVDAGLWRLRDPFPRAFLSEHLPYLVAGPQPAAEAPSPDRSPADI